MDKLDRDEKFWGGIFGVISILAAIAEMFIGGISTASVVSMVKDVSGTLVVVVLLVAFLRSLPKKPKGLAARLEQATEDWGSDNAPLIFKTEGYEGSVGSKYTQGFVLLQNPRSYVSLANSNLQKGSPEWHKFAQYGNGKSTGKFLDMPDYESMTQSDFDVLFVMGQSHFKKMPGIESIVKDITSAVNMHCDKEHISAQQVGTDLKIRLFCKRIETSADIEAFVDALDFVLSLMKVIA